MTYHYNIMQYRSSKDARLLTDRLVLTILFLCISALILNNPGEYKPTYALPALALITGVAMYMRGRRMVSFLEITDGTLSYLDTEKGEMITIPVNDITFISTRFCRLNVHTSDGIHALNLDLIRKEQTRWEIKEIIRGIARHKVEFLGQEQAVA